jgi:hypothetical protein
MRTLLVAAVAAAARLGAPTRHAENPTVRG